MIKDIKQYKAFQKEKSFKLKQEQLTNFKKANKDFDLIVSMLTQKYNPIRIYKYGSLQNEEQFKLYSDLDIIVEGLEEDLFLKASVDADRLSSFEVDFLEYESLPKWKQKQIKELGKMVYERI